MSGWLATILIFLPLAGALFIWLLPVGRLAGSFALLFALAEIGFWINGLVEFDFDGQGVAVRPELDLVQRPRRLVPRRLLRVLVLARRAGGRRHGRGDRVRLLGRPRAAARVLRADALPDVRRRGRLLLAGRPALLRLLRGDDDPALRPDRRLGRAGPAGSDREVRHLHDGGLAADARGRDRLRPRAGHVRPRRERHRATAPGSSSASPSRSRSRRRSSRSTAGCRTPTANRRPRLPPSSRA